ncbi:MAG TPA: hypothetical protein VJZ27_16845 [Aggregatilineales bacterium]|nr:hypothetical protein [Aggregatilineales bacterium]
MVDMQILSKLLTEQYTEANFEALLQIMDRLHDAAAIGDLKSVSPLDAREMIGWLDDLVFTAEETIRELQSSIEASEFRAWSDN